MNSHIIKEYDGRKLGYWNISKIVFQYSGVDSPFPLCGHCNKRLPIKQRYYNIVVIYKVAEHLNPCNCWGTYDSKKCMLNDALRLKEMLDKTEK